MKVFTYIILLVTLIAMGLLVFGCSNPKIEPKGPYVPPIPVLEYTSASGDKIYSSRTSEYYWYVFVEDKNGNIKSIAKH